MNKTLRNIIVATACVIVLAIVAIGVTFYFIAVHDAPPPDDSAYKTTYKPVPPETNAIVTLEKLAGKVKTNLKDYPELNGYLSTDEWEDFLSGNRIDFELQVPVVVRNQEALAILSEAMKKPKVQFAPFVTEDGTTRNFDPSDFFNLNKIVRVTWQNTKDGKVIFAWDDALANFQFTKRYGTAENITFINFLLALACERAGSNLMIKNIANLEDREIAIKTAVVLNDDAFKLADLKFWPRMEYAMADTVVDSTLRMMEKAHKRTLLGCYLFKPNDTRQRALVICETMRKAIDRGDLSFDIPPAPDILKMNFVEKRIYAWGPNSIGRMTMDLVARERYDILYKNILHEFACFRVITCAFALRAYWLDHGRLPDSLGELAPEYIKTVPLDIYGGKPVQYDRERGVVYSAGPKLVCSTGEFAREPNAIPNRERYFVLLDWSTSK